MTRTLLLLALGACTAPSTDQSPAPFPGFELTASGPAVRGGTVAITATLPVPPAPPNGVSIWFPLTNGGIGTGICHQQLRGNCLGITGPVAVYGPETTVNGAATLQFDVPVNYPHDAMYLQAVVRPPGAAFLSNPLEILVEDPAPADVAFCSTAPGPDCVDDTDMVLWLRGDDATAAGGTVAAWNDRSAAGNHAGQSTVDRQPELVAGAVLGHDALRFDGSNDRLDLPTNLFASGEDTYTVFAVLRADSTDAHIVGTGSSSAGFLSSYGSGLTVQGGRATLKANSNNNGTRLSSRDRIDGEVRLVSAVADASGSSLYIDGEPQGTATTPINGHGYSRSTIGASDGSTSNASRDPLAGDIAELVVFHRALGDAERAQVEEGLASYYGLSLWEETGCDGVVGSGATFDVCGECEGDGTSCDLVDAVNPSLWLRGDDLAGTVSGSVASWPDASSAGLGVTQSQTSRQPSFSDDALAGHGAVYFDGSDDRLDLSSNLFAPAATPKTVFVVLQTDDDNAHLLGTGSSSSGFLTSYGHGLMLSGGAPAMKGNSASSGLWTPGVARVDGDVPHVVSAVLESGGSQLFVDGTLVGTSSAPINAHGYSKSTLGASDGSASNGSQDPFRGWLAEVITVEGALDDATRESIEGYLANRYDVTLAAPGTIGGQRLWLDAADFAGAPDGTPVTDWADRSTFGTDASTGNAARTPTVQTVDGAPAVRFDGVDDQLVLADNVFGSGGFPMTAFAVVRTPDADGHIAGTGSSSAGFLSTYGGGLIVRGNAAGGKANSNSTGSFIQGSRTLDDGELHLVTYVADGSGSSLFVDGTLEGSGGAANAHGYGRSTLGASDGSSSGAARDPFEGDIAELLVYGFTLDDTMRQSIEAQLAAKHDLSMTPPPDDLSRGLHLFWAMDKSGTADRIDLEQGVGVAPWPPDAVGTVPVAGKVGLAQNVDGPNGYHFWRSSTGALDHGGGSFTWAGWVRLESFYDDQTFVGKWEYSPTQREYRIVYDVARAGWYFEVSANGQTGPGQSLEVLHPSAAVLGEWIFLEAWHDAQNDEIGLRVGDSTSRGTAVTAPWSAGVNFGNDDLNIAAHNQCADDHLHGDIDAVGMWRRVLTETERDALWNGGNGWEP